MIIFVEHPVDTNVVSTQSRCASYATFISLVEDYFSFLYKIEPKQEVILVPVFLSFING